MKPALVSVVVPIYNAQIYLRQCLQSIVEQTYSNIEIILVNDGSTDKSPQICDEFKRNDSRVTVFHQPNAGSVRARKKGIQHAVGSYIMFVDSDDWLPKNAIEKMMSYTGKQPDAVIGCFSIVRSGSAYIVKSMCPEGFYDRKALISLVYPIMIASDKRLFGVAPNLCTKLYKTSLLQEVSLNKSEEVTLGDDAVIVYDFLLRADAVYITYSNCYYYRQVETSLSKAYDKKLTNNYLTLVKEFDLIEAKCNKTYGISRQVNIYVLYILYCACVNEFVRSGRRYVNAYNDIIPLLENMRVQRAFDAVSVHEMPLQGSKKALLWLVRQKHLRLFSFCCRHIESVKAYARSSKIALALVCRIRNIKANRAPLHRTSSSHGRFSNQ